VLRIRNILIQIRIYGSWITNPDMAPDLDPALLGSVADPDPEPDLAGSETFGQIRIQSGTEINVSGLDPKKICKKEHYFQAEISWFHKIIHISHLQVETTIAVQ
jgi:hypothetical protein